MKLRVSRIQRFSLRDGPGIRTTVFCQGCGLRCWWCHNPQMQPVDAPDAVAWPSEQLVGELERDARYWTASGGGVTISGGEPLMQAEAVAELLGDLGRRGHHRTIDTCGSVTLAAVQQVAPEVDLWLWDVKSMDAEALWPIAEWLDGRRAGVPLQRQAQLAVVAGLARRHRQGAERAHSPSRSQ